MRFAALERNGAAGFARVSVVLPSCSEKTSALLWAGEDTGLWPYKLQQVQEAQKQHLGRIVVG